MGIGLCCLGQLWSIIDSYQSTCTETIITLQSAVIQTGIYMRDFRLPPMCK